jgi:hypothetical protein
MFDHSLQSITLEKVNQDIMKITNFENCYFSQVKFIDFNSVLMGIKPSQPELLSYFRKIKN